MGAFARSRPFAFGAFADTLKRKLRDDALEGFQWERPSGIVLSPVHHKESSARPSEVKPYMPRTLTRS